MQQRHGRRCRSKCSSSTITLVEAGMLCTLLGNQARSGYGDDNERACLNVSIESVHKICRQILSKIKLCDWPNKLDATSWQVLNTTESVGWTD